MKTLYTVCSNWPPIVSTIGGITTIIFRADKYDTQEAPKASRTKSPLWYKINNGGTGAKNAHAHMKTNHHGEIEFQCGVQRHMDDTILAPKEYKRCKVCSRGMKISI